MMDIGAPADGVGVICPDALVTAREKLSGVCVVRVQQHLL
jgi:hypothetical protein